MRKAFAAWLLATAFAASVEGESAAPDCNSLEAEASPQCARLLQETSRLHNLALAYQRMDNRKLARDTYSQAVASANRPIELFLAGTVPAAALLRRGTMHRELGQPDEAMADFTALIDADWGNSDARYERARTLLLLERLNEALADADAAAWLKPHTSDFHALRAQILGRLDRPADAAEAAIDAEKYAPGRHLNELSAILKGIGPRLSKERLEGLSEQREVQELELALRGIAPAIVRQRFLLQRECQDDDRHVLAMHLDRGRVTVTPSYAGAVGDMAVAASDERLVFTLGAGPCQVRVILGKGDLAAHSPPAADHSVLKPIQGQQSSGHVFYPSSPLGCAHGLATVRVYWGSVDYSYSVRQSQVRVRFDESASQSKQLLVKRQFGDEHCRITMQIWKTS
jgi:tetratricopeptide (TPR) repeat protein